jgi:hypothetical protein
MSLVLRNQIEASERSAEALERELLQESRRAVGSEDLRDLAQSLVQLYCSMTNGVARSHDLPSGDVKTSISAMYFEHFQGLNSSFAKVDSLIRQMEGWDYPIEGRDQFQRTWRELRAVVSFSPEDVQKAAEQVSRGEVRPLGEVRDELRDSRVH